MEYWKDCRAVEVFAKGNRVIKLLDSSGNYWVYLTQYTYDSLLSGIDLSEIKDKIPEDTFSFISKGPLLETGNKSFIQKAFVTNAVSNSVAYYAWTYLREMGLTGRQIIKLREKYSFDKISTSPFTTEEIHESFINQSAFFLNLCKEMNENDRFKLMAERLAEEEFNKYFGGYGNVEDLCSRYNRRIFHYLLECKAMRSDYAEGDQFHLNTGVFAEKHTLETGGYLVDVIYLAALGMRACKSCH